VRKVVIIILGMILVIKAVLEMGDSIRGTALIKVVMEGITKEVVLIIMVEDIIKVGSLETRMDTIVDLIKGVVMELNICIIKVVSKI
jgi:hypothetical protein